MSVFTDKKEYGGDIFSVLENTQSFVLNHINLKGEIKGLYRTDTYEIPVPALREALINAIIHRDYINRGRDIKVGIYDDIVNIVSPGSLPYNITIEDVFNGRSEARNRVVAHVFKELNLIEQWGSGINRIISTSVEHGLKTPKIAEQNDFFDIEFYRPQTITDDKQPELQPESKTAQPELKDRLGQGIKKGQQELQPESSLENRRKTVGKPSEKKSFADDYGRLRTITDDYERLEEAEKRILLYLLGNKSITRKTAVELLNLQKTKVHEVLAALVGKNHIEKQGQGRSTFYTLSKLEGEK